MIDYESCRQTVLACIRSGAAKMPDLQAQKIERQKIIEANRRASVARAQAARLKAKRISRLESSEYYRQSSNSV